MSWITRTAVNISFPTSPCNGYLWLYSMNSWRAEMFCKCHQFQDAKKSDEYHHKVFICLCLISFKGLSLAVMRWINTFEWSTSSILRSFHETFHENEILSSLPKTTLVPGHSGEHVAVESVEVVMVGHIMGNHLCIDDVALILLARLVQSLNSQQHTVRYNFLLTNCWTIQVRALGYSRLFRKV